VIRVEVKGDKELMRELRGLGDRAKPTARRLISRFVGAVVPRAKALAPDDPSGERPDLKDSIRGSVKTVDGAVKGFVMAGGDPLTPKLSAEGRKNASAHQVYATIQHEDTTLRHAHGQANFIGQPFHEQVPKTIAEFEKEILDARA
jgi:hypothetical protein